MITQPMFSSFFFFNDTATTEIYTLSLHDALPIYPLGKHDQSKLYKPSMGCFLNKYVFCLGHSSYLEVWVMSLDRKSTRLNSSHLVISYAVFCLKKKKENKTIIQFT